MPFTREIERRALGSIPSQPGYAGCRTFMFYCKLSIKVSLYLFDAVHIPIQQLKIRIN